jgi:hypothetical protein
LYSAVVEEDDRAAFQVISNHLAAATCLSAQEHAYRYAYLIWSGPPAALPQ